MMMTRSGLVAMLTVVVVCWHGSAGAEERDLELGTIHYLEQGAGPDLILLHGWGDDLHTWERVVEPLAARFHLWAIDTLGFGGSSNYLGRWTVEAYVDQLATFMVRMGIGNAILVGNSMGSQIAVAFAERHPTLVRGLVLIDASGGSLVSDAFPATAGAVVAQCREAFDEARVRELVRRVLRELLHDDGLVEEKLESRFLERFRTATGREALFQSAVQFRYDLEAGLARVLEAGLKGAQRCSLPVLVLWGAHDPWFPSATAGKLRGIGDGICGAGWIKVAILERSGHLPQAEEPGAVAAAIGEHFAEAN